MTSRIYLVAVLAAYIALFSADRANAQLKTWDGKHSIERIEVSLVYFLPRDRTALPDWRERLDYFKQRIEQFHQREFQGQSSLTAKVAPEPFVSERSIEQLRAGDANFIFFQTLREVDERLQFGRAKERTAFPILLVLSDINWRPLDDFFRAQPVNDKFEFEGQLINGRHHPGSSAGGARATYFADRGVGWGLVSADGWRVPYCGSDCVAYHEGVGHTIGLPHPEPGNGSVMSLGQYEGWLSQSWLDDAQKTRLGWKKPDSKFDRSKDLFSVFKALPNPLIPMPGEQVDLKLDLPLGIKLKHCRVRLQTDHFGPWIDVIRTGVIPDHSAISLGQFDRATPVSYRVNIETTDGQTAELWGYFQVRTEPKTNPVPTRFDDLSIRTSAAAEAVGNVEIDVLKRLDLKRDQVHGDWQITDGKLLSPKVFAARLELPDEAPAEYRLVVIVEPLDKPNGFILGQRVNGHRCLVLLNFANGDKASGAIENVDGKNFGANSTKFERAVFQEGVPSQVICTVRKDSVRVSVDGLEVISWKGDAARLSLGDYWKTPHEKQLFIGTYDCRYRIHRISLSPL